MELEVGRCLTGLLNTDCAVLHLRESVRLDPTNEMALAYLGQSLGAQKHYKEGLELLEVLTAHLLMRALTETHSVAFSAHDSVRGVH